MMRALSFVFFAGLVAAPAAGKSQWPIAPGGADWSPQRATGDRDVFVAGDHVNAWAPAQPDGGAEWLRLGYAEAVMVREIRIWQNEAPGAISRVTVTVDGREVEVWSGTDKAGVPAPVEKVVTLAAPQRTDTVTVYLDTARVRGWNEIDAVEVVASDGRRLWATEAAASSAYAGALPAHPLGHLLGRAVRVQAAGGVHPGVVVAVEGDWLTVFDGERRRMINIERIDLVEWTP